jgi:hypothetical protein
MGHFRTFFSSSSFYSDSPQNMGLHVEYFIAGRSGKDVGFKRCITGRRYGIIIASGSKRRDNGLCVDYWYLVSGLRQAARFDSEQMAHEEIHASSAGVGSLAHAVAAARHDQQIEIFIRFDKCVDYLHG